MRKICEHETGSLLGVSYNSASARDLLNEESYDLLVVVSSWEERVRAILDAPGLRAHSAVLILYDELDSEGLRASNDAQLSSFMSSIAEYHPLVSKATDLEGTWSALFTRIAELYNLLKRPLRILVDASTCQRYHILALLANGFEYGLVRRISFFYAEGKYPPKPAHDELVFGDGVWRSVPVPGLQGEYNPGKELLYYVSVGFEGYKTLRVVARADPDRVVLLFPDPGTTPDYAERTRRANASLVEQYAITSEYHTIAPAGDAISAWAAMSATQLERTSEENVVYLLNGTKPHSIAMGLRALDLRSPAVLYSIPEAYSVINIIPTGIFWRFDIECRTVLI